MYIHVVHGYLVSLTRFVGAASMIVMSLSVSPVRPSIYLSIRSRPRECLNRVIVVTRFLRDLNKMQKSRKLKAFNAHRMMIVVQFKITLIDLIMPYKRMTPRSD